MQSTDQHVDAATAISIQFFKRINTNVLDSLNKLTISDKKERIRGSTALIQHLNRLNDDEEFKSVSCLNVHSCDFPLID